jgi:hypothetical protein
VQHVFGVVSRTVELTLLGFTRDVLRDLEL